MATTLTSQSGVVAIDLSTQDGFYRLSTTESVTGWVVTGATDGQTALIRVTKNSGHSVVFSGLIDAWIDGIPKIAENETIYFPIIVDVSNIIGQSSVSPQTYSEVLTGDGSQTSWTINHNLGTQLIQAVTVSSPGDPIVSVISDPTGDDSCLVTLASPLANGVTAALYVSPWGSTVDGRSATNLGWDNETSTVSSSSGNDAILTEASSSWPGLMPASDKSKLDAITGTNTGNQTAAGVVSNPAGNLASDNVQDALEELQVDRDNTQSDLDAAEATLATAVTDIATNVTDITEAKLLASTSQLTSNNNAIAATALTARVSATETATGVNAGNIVAIDSAATAQATEISNLQSASTFQAAVGSSNASDISDIQDLDVVQSGLITALQAADATIQSDITSLEAADTAHDGQITTLQGRATTTEGDVTTLQSNVTSNDGDITTLQGRATTTESDVTTLQADVTSNDGDIATLQGQVVDPNGLSTVAHSATGPIVIDLGTYINTLVNAANNVTDISFSNVGSMVDFGEVATVAFKNTSGANITVDLTSESWYGEDVSSSSDDTAARILQPNDLMVVTFWGDDWAGSSVYINSVTHVVGDGSA